MALSGNPKSETLMIPSTSKKVLSVERLPWRSSFSYKSTSPLRIYLVKKRAVASSIDPCFSRTVFMVP